MTNRTTTSDDRRNPPRPAERLTQAQLESYLWGAATLLRGVIDAGDYKQFIFPLLFFKRVSDVYDEEYANALALSGGDDGFAAFAENHRFLIPPRAHWNDVRAITADVGRALQQAMREIEQANPALLSGIFGDAQWTNKNRLPDRTLCDLIEHFSSRTLSLAAVPEDELGQAYEYLIKKFADDSGHTAAEFYTNRTVVRLMTRMLEPKEGESIYDPTCGTGGMLLSAAAAVRDRGMEHRSLKLYGQELNLLTSAIARMNLFLHGVEDFRIERGNTLSHPMFVEGDRLHQFDMILANPPYSIKQWDRAKWSADSWGRNRYGVPPQGRADYAFFQHILASMDAESGRCAILFPHGVLFREEERAMRQRIIEADLIECVLGLGPNLFYNSPMEACVVVCRARKEPERQGKILFIDAKDEVTRERAQSFLTEAHIERIIGTWRDFEAAPGFAAVVDNDEILGRDANLSIPLYVRSAKINGNGVSDGNGLAAAISEWQASSQRLRSTMDDLFTTLKEAGVGRQ